jgi:group I intron endonuclease
MFKIYIHLNKINNKAYIGQTCQTLDKRCGNGVCYKHSPHFWNAIQKYGWGNFEHIIWADNLTQEEANCIEKKLIALFNTTNREFGYNCRDGGDNSKHSKESIEKMRLAKKGHPVSEDWKEKIRQTNSKTVRQYTKNGEFVKQYQSMSQAERETGIKCQSISACCRDITKSAGGYVWEVV